MITEKFVLPVFSIAARYPRIVKLIPLMLLLLALASGVIADSMPGGSTCPGC